MNVIHVLKNILESVINDGEALSISFEGDAFEIPKDNIIYINSLLVTVSAYPNI